MKSLFPYLTISRYIGASYGRVLAIAGRFDAGCSVGDIKDPLAKNVHEVWCQEQGRRVVVNDASAQ